MQILEKLKKEKTLYPIVKNPELGDSLSFFFHQTRTKLERYLRGSHIIVKLIPFSKSKIIS